MDTPEVTAKTLGLVQFFGETREFKRNLCETECCITMRKWRTKASLQDLIFIRKQKIFVDQALNAVRLELDDQGFCMPSLIGWRNSDQDRFFTDPVFSGSKRK